MAEEMALEDAGKTEHTTRTTILSRGEPAFTDAQSLVHDVKPAPLGSAHNSTAVLPSSNLSTRHGCGAKDWANMLFGSNPPIPLASKAKRKQKNARRLGVCVIE